MAIKKVKRQKVAPVPREPRADAPDKRACATCGTERKLAEFGYVMSSLLDPTEYACDIACYKPWQAKRTRAMPSKL